MAHQSGRLQRDDIWDGSNPLGSQTSESLDQDTAAGSSHQTEASPITMRPASRLSLRRSLLQRLRPGRGLETRSPSEGSRTSRATSPRGLGITTTDSLNHSTAEPTRDSTDISAISEHGNSTRDSTRRDQEIPTQEESSTVPPSRDGSFHQNPQLGDAGGQALDDPDDPNERERQGETNTPQNPPHSLRRRWRARRPLRDTMRRFCIHRPWSAHAPHNQSEADLAVQRTVRLFPDDSPSVQIPRIDAPDLDLEDVDEQHSGEHAR